MLLLKGAGFSITEIENEIDYTYLRLIINRINEKNSIKRSHFKLDIVKGVQTAYAHFHIKEAHAEYSEYVNNEVENINRLTLKENYEKYKPKLHTLFDRVKKKTDKIKV